MCVLYLRKTLNTPLNMASTTQIFLVSFVSWLLSVLATVAGEDICTYKPSIRDPVSHFKTCQWGCCYTYSDPCCEPPVALIVGCTIGAFLCLMLIIIAICCCYCCCCRRETLGQQHVSRGHHRGGHMVARYPNPHQPHGGSVQISSVMAPSSAAAGQHDPTIPSLPPGVPLSPPSYEEAMAGESNPAFKPDNSIPPL